MGGVGDTPNIPAVRTRIAKNSKNVSGEASRRISSRNATRLQPKSLTRRTDSGSPNRDTAMYEDVTNQVEVRRTIPSSLVRRIKDMDTRREAEEAVQLSVHTQQLTYEQLQNLHEQQQLMMEQKKAYLEEQYANQRQLNQSQVEMEKKYLLNRRHFRCSVTRFKRQCNNCKSGETDRPAVRGCEYAHACLKSNSLVNIRRRKSARKI
uniref:AlNc14C318G10562 protein n=1 Tax=Albugo laibachii Nc14 TaxID=890382 RepID=F0WWC7_9STRA|nr:AlNc14C318G10562 [Albugo laibachii Nc14]|eukprot:CCA25747.1 AlNc14C318G10562 [Albugo laibachii Nc14]